jgi:murein DD-endopeptidase MepM/ murein hydrolase activator NlpD
MADGTVERVVNADPDGTGKRRLILRHPTPEGTVLVEYAHLRRILVRSGSVRQASRSP